MVQSGRGADVGGLIGKAGLSFSVSLDKSEGFAQAVRNLIDLSTIEVLGKLARVPYWECLAIHADQPDLPHRGAAVVRHHGRRRARPLRRSGAGARRLPAQRRARRRELSGAIARYQADNDLVPSGRVDFDLYYRLARQRARAPADAARGCPPRWHAGPGARARRARRRRRAPRPMLTHHARPAARLPRRRDA